LPNETDQSPLWPADNPATIAHINMLQGTITRLANNSSSCKTWRLLLVSALLSLAGASHFPAMVSFALVPVVIFGLLDAMYLAQERAYRKLSDSVVEKIRGGTYSRALAFEAKAEISPNGFFGAIGCWSIFPVYGGLLVVYGVLVSVGWLNVIAVAGSK
jgi:hypothetical protein